MVFAAIYVPQLMVQAVARIESHLCASGLALVDGTPPLMRVIAMNDSARRAGIQLGMAKSQVVQFRGVEIRGRSRAQEEAAHAALLDLAWSISPHIENTAVDTIVLDLAGLHFLFGSDELIAHDLMQRARDLGLAANVAISSNIEVAIRVARGFSGVTLISSGKESMRMGVLPVAVLSPTNESLETLDRWGIKTCKDLAALPLLDLSERLGQEGVRLHELACGAVSRSMVLAEPGMRFEEKLELDTAEEELEPVSFLLGRLLDQVCARLQTRSLAAAAIHLRFDLGDLFENETKNFKPSSSQDSISKTYNKSLTLPVPMRDSKMLLRLLRLQLQSDPPMGSIAKIMLSADPSRPRPVQAGLFVTSSPDPEKLELTVARLGKLVGNANVGSPQLVDTHLRGEFRMSRFKLPMNEQHVHRKLKSDARAAIAKGNRSQSRQLFMGFRIFRPRLLATIELLDGCPSRVFFRGIYGEVTAVSGPWRTSGDWWCEKAWQHDEWDIEIRLGSASDNTKLKQPHSGMYCVYFDSVIRSWFVQGMYD